MSGSELISFPPGVLGADAVRLPVLVRQADWFAVNKPAGVAVCADPLEPAAPGLLEAIGAALHAGKPQLQRLGIADCARVHGLDAEATGALVLATSPEAHARLRNAVGSRRVQFVYEFVASGRLACEVDCALPLARHSAEPRMVVSHRDGRISETSFRLVRELGEYRVWEARTRENRPHQVRLHAAESGLRIPGEAIYGRVPLVYLSAVKRGFRPGRGEERSLHSPLALHLREIEIHEEGATVRVSAPLPRSLAVMIELLERHGGARRARSAPGFTGLPPSQPGQGS